MSMSTYVIGFKPPDKKWKEMKAIWDACKKAHVNPPDEVFDYFGDDNPDETGVEVKLPVEEFVGDMTEGYELKVANIPKNVTVIRFYNSF